MLIEAEQKRRGREEELLIVHAWHCEAFARTKKLPRLESLLKDKKPKDTVDTPEQMLEWARVFTLTHGGKIVKRDAGSTMQDS